MSGARTSPAARELLHAAGACTLLVVAYFLVPVEPEVGGTQLVVRMLLTIAVTVVLALVIGRLVVRLAQGRPGVRPANLLVALSGGLVLFALIDYRIAVTDPGQFVQLRTKIDGLYFAVTTLATVGYGDVSANGQLARAVVTAQQLFNLVLLGTGATVLVNRLIGRRPPARPDRDEPG